MDGCAENDIQLSIIIVNWNTRDLLRDCLGSLYSKPCGISFETYVVDNASDDGSADMVADEFPQVHLIRNTENVGYAKANNKAMLLSKAGTVLLLNSDTVVDPDVLPETYRLLWSSSEIGCLGCKLIGPDGELQDSVAYAFPDGPSVGGPDEFVDEGLVRCALVWGAFMMVKRQVIDQVGMLDEDFFMFSEDVDWCWRMHENGWKIVYDTSHSIIHIYRASCKRVDKLEQKTRLMVGSVLLQMKHTGLWSSKLRRWRRMFHHGWCTGCYWLRGSILGNARSRAKMEEHLLKYKAIKAIRKLGERKSVPGSVR